MDKKTIYGKIKMRMIMKNKNFIVEFVLLICIITSSFFTNLNVTIFNASA